MELKPDDIILYSYNYYSSIKYSIGIVEYIEGNRVHFYTTDDPDDVLNYKCYNQPIAGSACDLEEVIKVIPIKEVDNVKKEYKLFPFNNKKEN